MKIRLIAMAMISAIFMQMAAVPASGARGASEQNVYPAMEKEFGYKDFNFLRVSHDPVSGRGTYCFSKFNISVVKSDQYKVVMSVKNRDDIPLFDIRHNGNELELIANPKRYPYHSRGGAEPVADVKIYMPEFSGAAVGGSSSISLSGDFFGPVLTLKLSGSAYMTGLSGKWDSASVNMSGASKAECGTIKVGTLALEASGAASLTFQSLSADRTGASFSGAAVVKTPDICSGELKLTASGGSALSFSGKMTSVNATLSGAASVTLSGSGQSLALTASGGSSLKARTLMMHDVSVSLSGASKAEVAATDNLVTEVSAAASLDYYGNPKNVRSKSDNIRAH